jgi:hypothetical protein
MNEVRQPEDCEPPRFGPGYYGYFGDLAAYTQSEVYCCSHRRQADSAKRICFAAVVGVAVVGVAVVELGT